MVLWSDILQVSTVRAVHNVSGDFNETFATILTSWAHMTLTTGGNPLQIYKYQEQILPTFKNLSHTIRKLYNFLFVSPLSHKSVCFWRINENGDLNCGKLWRRCRLRIKRLTVTDLRHVSISCLTRLTKELFWLWRLLRPLPLSQLGQDTPWPDWLTEWVVTIIKEHTYGQYGHHHHGHHRQRAHMYGHNGHNLQARNIHVRARGGVSVKWAGCRTMKAALCLMGSLL